jgi:hypothetical protein
MVDRHVHLWPLVDRCCHRRDGLAKLRLTQAEAEAKAAGQRHGYHAYKGPSCGWWHTGRRRRRNRRRRR